jgi:hypothetical protein
MASTYFRETATGRVVETANPQYWTGPEYVRLSVKEGHAAYVEQRRADMREIVKPGDTIYCALESVSSSGMSRRISFFVAQIDDKGRPYIRNVTGLVGDCAGYSAHDGKKGLRVSGAGMDMGFSVVYSLGASLWPNGTPEPHSRRNGEPDSEGGYALKHEWL